MAPLLRQPSLSIAAFVFLVATAIAAGLAFAGSSLLEDRRFSLPLLLVILTTGVFALLGWAAEKARREELANEHNQDRKKLAAEYARREAEIRERQEAVEGELHAARERAGADRAEREAAVRELTARLEGQEKALRETREELEGKVHERNQELMEERRSRARAEQARRDEKEWALHLRKEIMRLQSERGVLGNTSDVRRLVLRTAMTLVGAQKGILLSREDLDSDGDLDLACYEGFENDPESSAVAQRFATEVIERDVTLRQEEVDIAPERRTPADDEIKNLLAIPIYIADKFTGVVVLANKEGGFHDYDDEVLLALGDHAGAVLHNQRLQDDLRTSYVGTVRVLANAIEAKDRFLRGHAEEVSDCVAAVADRLGLEPERREELVYSSLLHDVGKIGISERILMKPAALTPEEQSVIQLHPRIGYRLIQQVPSLKATELAILHHHERWDGDGYPGGLKGEDIPLEARIIGVADAFSAMTADRPYRRGMSLDEACEELEHCAGSQFDPIVVHLFVDEIRKNPPSANGDPLHDALSDPELDARRGDDPILGAGSVALTDNLTLLYCHSYLHEAAEAEARRASVQGRPFSIIMVELTDIARINADVSYSAGDEAIKRVARVVERSSVRCGGTAARFSGRRIALLAAGDEQAADDCAAEISSELGDGPSVRVVAATWRPGESGDDVIARARGALTVSSVS